MLKILAITVVSASLLAGCSKKSEAEAPAADASAPAADSAEVAAPASAASTGPESLPGSGAVQAAMEKKDYSSAVTMLLGMGGGFKRGEDKWVEYMNFFGEIKYTLTDLAESDPKAAEALMTLRAFQSGR